MIERKPSKRPSGCNCWPARYIVFPLKMAFVAPPGTAILLCATSAIPLAPDVFEFSEFCVIGITVTPAVAPPHSGPQSSTYAVEPSGENTALMGLSKLPLGPVLTGNAQNVGRFCGSQSCAFR